MLQHPSQSRYHGPWVRQPLSVAVLLALALGWAAPASAEDAGDGVGRITASYPGVRIVHEESGRVRAVHGKPMARGRTPIEAVDRWLREHGRVFGAGDLDLRLLRHTRSWSGLRVLTFAQYVEGVPVERGTARFMVMAGADCCVVYAAAHVAQTPAAGTLDLAFLEGVEAGVLAAGLADYEHLEHWGEPELVVLGAGSNAAPALAWKVYGYSYAEPAAWSLFLDAATGELRERRNELFAGNVAGTVTAFASPGERPDIDVNPPQPTGLGRVRVEVAGSGEFTHADDTGYYELDTAQPFPITLNVFLDGKLAVVETLAGANLSESVVVPAPGVADITFTQSTSAQSNDTAQVNSYVVLNDIAEYFIGFSPDLEDQLFVPNKVTVNANGPTGGCSSLGGNDTGIPSLTTHLGDICVNSGYSTSIAHEYGHLLLYFLGTPVTNSTAFSEGFCDLVGMMVYGGHQTAVDLFYLPEVAGQPCEDTFIRDPLQADVQYPRHGQALAPPTCSGPVTENGSAHYGGMMLTGIWWQMRQSIDLATLGEITTAWMQVTLGVAPVDGDAVYYEGADPGILIEVLTVDDALYGDGDLANGTPHFAEICAAFAAHNICCGPPAAPLPGAFIRGDANNDQAVDIGDALFLLGYLFSGGPAPSNCDAGDVNDDGAVDIGDSIRLLDYLFEGGAEPDWPFPTPCFDRGPTPASC